LNFEKENLIKKSKEEFNGVKREVSNRNSIGIQKHSFSLILNFKVCISSREKKEKLLSTQNLEKNDPPKNYTRSSFLTLRAAAAT